MKTDPIIEISNKKFGNDVGCMIIGEVAQAHDGSLGAAHAYIDAIASSGADAVKFQTHIASAETTPAEPWRVNFSSQDATRYDYWKRMEFTEAQWRELANHAREKNLIFLSSPFSMEAVELLVRIGVPAWKVASGEVGNASMLDRMAASRLPILISTGMSSLSEIDAAVSRVKEKGSLPVVMQCTSSYPCPPERVGLNMISFYRERYGCSAGLSDHSGTIYPGLAAATMGAAIIEVHVTLSRESFGPDVPVSVTVDELEQLAEGVRFIEKMRVSEVDKDEVAREMEGMREIFTKSVVARVDIEAGTTLKAEYLDSKKPGTGIPAGRLVEIIGSRLMRNVKADEVIREEDISETNV